MIAGFEPSRARAVLERVRSPLRRLRSAYRTLTAPLRGFPSALIIGAQKGGTTSLFNYLIAHPDVVAPFGKEIHFFDLHHGRGVQWYRGRFPYERRLRAGALTLDASPYYLVHPHAPRRAAQLLPRVKLIALLRNPVDRAFSHYQHEVRGGREALSFAEAIARESERLAGEMDRLGSDPHYYSFNHHRYSYLLRGVYVEQLRRWGEHFPTSQLLVLQSEKLFHDPKAAMAAVHDFLGLRRIPQEWYRTFLQGRYDHRMPEKLRAELVAYFEPYNHELYQFLGEEFDWT